MNAKTLKAGRAQIDEGRSRVQDSPLLSGRGVTEAPSTVAVGAPSVVSSILTVMIPASAEAAATHVSPQATMHAIIRFMTRVSVGLRRQMLRVHLSRECFTFSLFASAAYMTRPRRTGLRK